MQLHTIQATKKRIRRKRIGRGGKRGTYSGRGMKGQKSRAGASSEPLIRQFIKRYPKLRGYRAQMRKKIQATVTLSSLEQQLNGTAPVTPKLLLKLGVIATIKGRMPRVKILGSGEVTRPFTIQGCEVSGSAKLKIEKAGGKIVTS